MAHYATLGQGSTKPAPRPNFTREYAPRNGRVPLQDLKTWRSIHAGTITNLKSEMAWSESQSDEVRRNLNPASRLVGLNRLRSGALELIAAPSRAFTLVELLVVIAVIGLLASMLLPALSKAKAKGQTIVCLSNLKQLQLGWKLYEDENDDRFPANVSQGTVNHAQNVSNSWVLGTARFDTNNAGITNGSLFPLVGSSSIYRCPADRSVVQGAGKMTRSRSYSVEGWLGSNFDLGSGWVWPPRNPADLPYPGYQMKTRASSITTPGPSEVFVFIDELEATIDDGVFVIGMVDWFDLPATRHLLGANLSYLDGHAESHRWRAPKRFDGTFGTSPQSGPDAQDKSWLTSRLPTQ